MNHSYHIDRWNIAHAFLASLATAVVIYLGKIEILLLEFLISFIYYIGINRHAFPKEFGFLGGAANRLTIGRFLILLLAFG